MNYEEKIVADEYGTLIIKGTKISVSTILRKLSEGVSTSDIIKNYPEVSATDISICLVYAGELVDVIDFTKSMNAINLKRQKIKAFLAKVEAAKGNPPPAFR